MIQFCVKKVVISSFFLSQSVVSHYFVSVKNILRWPENPENDTENEVRRHSSMEEETVELLEVKSVIQSTIV